ncbi:MAG TPA: dihydropteroate synthase [Dehalococcoidia bacterium]|nr:dihydropteroate synthase [Dehalococcoidia bacterium]
MSGRTLIGGREFRWGERTYIMGIINLTPDSFSSDGLAGRPEEAVSRALEMEAEGADIIDLGGESTRPQASQVDAEEELSRVLPVLERLVGRLKVPISIDTYRAITARRCLEAGAHMINDVWGLKRDPGLVRVVAERGVPVVLVSNQREGPAKGDIMAEVRADLERGTELVLKAGVPRENIILDPGIGFGKTVEQNLALVGRLQELRALGLPLLLGTSRKSFIGAVLDLPPEERLEGTAATVAIGIARGADIVRVHDVGPMARLCRMSDAVVRGKW